MRCKHLSPPSWCARVKDDTSKPYRIWFECPDCGRQLGDIALGPSNDRIPRAEMDLAINLHDIHVLWEPGRSRNEIIALAVDEAAGWV